MTYYAHTHTQPGPRLRTGWATPGQRLGHVCALAARTFISHPPPCSPYTPTFTTRPLQSLCIHILNQALELTRAHTQALKLMRCTASTPCWAWGDAHLPTLTCTAVTLQPACCRLAVGAHSKKKTKRNAALAVDALPYMNVHAVPLLQLPMPAPACTRCACLYTLSLHALCKIKMP